MKPVHLLRLAILILTGIVCIECSVSPKHPHVVVILVDDMVDSGWTLTLCGAHLRRAGSGDVYPFALASLRGA